MKITVVIPTYNEAENIPILMSEMFSLGIPELSVLIVDDNSPDGSGKVADKLHEKLGARLEVIHRKEKEGLGRAYIEGFNQALANGAEVIGMMDADLSHPPEKLPQMLAALEEADVVIGSRYIKGGSLDRDWPIWRKWLSGFGNLYARIILGLPIKDVTGGYRLWRRSALEAIPFGESRSSGYIFIVELAYLASLKGCKFRETPIYFSERQSGASKMTLKIQVEAAFRVWQLRRVYRELRRGSSQT